MVFHQYRRTTTPDTGGHFLGACRGPFCSSSARRCAARWLRSVDRRNRQTCRNIHLCFFPIDFARWADALLDIKRSNAWAIQCCMASSTSGILYPCCTKGPDSLLILSTKQELFRELRSAYGDYDYHTTKDALGLLGLRQWRRERRLIGSVCRGCISQDR